MNVYNQTINIEEWLDGVGVNSKNDQSKNDSNTNTVNKNTTTKNNKQKNNCQEVYDFLAVFFIRKITYFKYCMNINIYSKPKKQGEYICLM